MRHDEYLWNRRGAPDPEVQQLEELLGGFRYRPPAQKRGRFAIGIAAAVLVAVGASVYWQHLLRPAWEVDGLAGRTQLRQGGQLATDHTSRARLNIADVGHIEIAPDTQVRLIRSRQGEHRLALKQGRIHAFIWAPPGDFIVDTPSAATVDLGCAYDLTVQPNGEALVEVSSGWVAFEGGGKLSFIPAQAACVTRPRLGPGTPYYKDSSVPFIQAVEQFDLYGDVVPVLQAAGPRDAFSLWHVLRRVPPAQRARVYDRLSRLGPVPSGVTREGIVFGDPRMFDALWDSLGLGQTAWWQHWKQKIPIER